MDHFLSLLLASLPHYFSFVKLQTASLPSDNGYYRDILLEDMPGGRDGDNGKSTKCEVKTVIEEKVTVLRS